APRDGLTVLPTHFFYPFPFGTPKEKRKPAADSYVMHHWSMSWNPTAPNHRHPEPDVPIDSYRIPYERLLSALRPKLVVEWGTGLNTEMALSVGAEVFSIEDNSKRLPREARPRSSVLLTSLDN